MATEKLKFKLEIYSAYFKNPPIVDIKIGDNSYFNKEITSTEKQPTVIEFEHDCENDKTYTLNLIRSGKTIRDTVIKDDKIIADQMLYLKYFEIDEIDLGSLVYEGVYTPIYAEPWASQQAKAGIKLPKTLKNITKMGHNGTWAFTFTSPFYMWLLENLY